MVKGKSPGPLSNSVKKKKPSVDDVKSVQNQGTEMNGKTRRKRKAGDGVCENASEENKQITLTVETNMDKKKKRKCELKENEANVDVAVITPKKKKKSIPQKKPIEDTTLPQNDHAELKKKTKNKSSVDLKATPLAQEQSGDDEEEDLSPEEKRVLERKLKKIRNKEEKKKQKEEGKSTQQENIKANLAEKQALLYLTRWSEKKDEWKFQKSRQTWLLKHMYDSAKVPDGSFEVLLSYMEGLKGAARETSLKKAEALVRWEGQGGEADTADAEKRKQRAKMVMQQL